MRIPEVLAAYRMHEDSQSLAATDPSRADELVNVISAHFRNHRMPSDISQAEAEAMSNAHIIAARQHLRSGRFLVALKHMRQAFRLHPCSYLRLRSWRTIVKGLVNRIGYKVFKWLGRG